MDYDVIVVGAGVEGSSTAYQLIKNGVKRVLLLEQFYALHPRGSSHGGSRFTRLAVIHHLKEFTKMITTSNVMFAELQEESGKKIYYPVEPLTFNSRKDPKHNQIIDYLKNINFPLSILSAEKMNRCYKAQLYFPDDHIGFTEPNMKLLDMPALLSTFQRLFLQGGGVLLDNHCVTAIVPGEKVTVRTNKGDFSSGKLVITAGAWAPKLLSKLGVQLPIKVARAEVLYWRVDKPENFKPEVFSPVVFESGRDHYYTFPQFEYPGMIKVYHRTYRDIDPEERDEGGAGPESLEKVAQFIKTYLRGVSTTPAIFEPCVYSITSDWLPIIDYVPAHSNIVFAAGMSGKGAMISPAVGLLLSEMALDKTLSFDLTPFRLARFHKSKL